MERFEEDLSTRPEAFIKGRREAEALRRMGKFICGCGSVADYKFRVVDDDGAKIIKIINICSSCIENRSYISEGGDGNV